MLMIGSLLRRAIPKVRAWRSSIAALLGPERSSADPGSQLRRRRAFRARWRRPRTRRLGLGYALSISLVAGAAWVPMSGGPDEASSPSVAPVSPQENAERTVVHGLQVRAQSSEATGNSQKEGATRRTGGSTDETSAAPSASISRIPSIAAATPGATVDTSLVASLGEVHISIPEGEFERGRGEESEDDDSGFSIRVVTSGAVCVRP